MQRALARRGLELKRIYRPPYQSGTSNCRERLAKFCVGCGVDIGAGGDPITPSAIRVDLPVSYSNVGQAPVQLTGDARNLTWFADNALDYVYSSHVLEDFYPIDPVLEEWLRILKCGGNLVLYCPDQIRYEKYCRSRGEQPNPYHKDPHFNIDTVKLALSKIGQTKIIYEARPFLSDCDHLHLVDNYSWELVASKIAER
jgi:predicted SAM-dependent methyltransferase